MNRRSLLVRLGLLASAVGGAVWLRDHVLWKPPSVAFAGGVETTGWLDWSSPRASVPTVRAVVGGRVVTALIDSGAQYSVIDRRLFAALGVTTVFDMPMVAYGVGGGAQVGRGVVLSVQVGGLTLSGLRTAILDLGPLAAGDGLGAPLILGQDVLGALVLELDVQRRRLSLGAPGRNLDPDLWPVDVEKRGAALTAEVSVEGAVVRAVIDTGATSLLSVSRDAAEGAGLLDGRVARRGSSLVLGGQVEARVVEARTVTFADQLYRRVPVSIYADGGLPGVPEALLGMAAFEGRRVALDLGAGRLSVSRPLDLTVG